MSQLKLNKNKIIISCLILLPYLIAQSFFGEHSLLTFIFILMYGLFIYLADIDYFVPLTTLIITLILTIFTYLFSLYALVVPIGNSLFLLLLISAVLLFREKDN